MADTARTPFDAGTFGSRTTPDMAPQLRRAAAAARAGAASISPPTRWRSTGRSADAADGTRRGTGRQRPDVGYGELTRGQRLAQVIARRVAPIAARRSGASPARRCRRSTGAAFVTGRHEYTSDMTPAAAALRRDRAAAAFGATLWHRATTAAAAAAVGRARRARRRLRRRRRAPTRDARAASRIAVAAEWSAAPHRSRTSSSSTHLRRTAAHAASDAGAREPARSRADGGSPSRTLEATYTVAYIAHVPLEPRAAVAEWDGDRPHRLDRHAAPVRRARRARRGVPPAGETRARDRARHRLGYGGKHTGEAAIEAARLARAAGRPVKVVWTREEEFTWAYFRPAGVIDVRSGVDADGRLAAWEFHNYNSGASGIRTPYAVPHQRIAFHPAHRRCGRARTAGWPRRRTTSRANRTWTNWRRQLADRPAARSA